MICYNVAGLFFSPYLSNNVVGTRKLAFLTCTVCNWKDVLFQLGQRKRHVHSSPWPHKMIAALKARISKALSKIKNKKMKILRVIVGTMPVKSKGLFLFVKYGPPIAQQCC